MNEHETGQLLNAIDIVADNDALLALGSYLDTLPGDSASKDEEFGALIALRNDIFHRANRWLDDADATFRREWPGTTETISSIWDQHCVG